MRLRYLEDLEWKGHINFFFFFVKQVLLNAGFLRSLNMSIRKVLLSPDHTVFAYNTEREGMEYGELHFKDLEDREDWEVKFKRAWSKENSG